MRPTRRHRAGHPQAPPYSASLRPGFTVPVASRPRRWALTPPFHPYPSPHHVLSLKRTVRSRRRFVFCGTFQGLPPLGLRRATCPAESGPSSGAETPAAPWPAPPPWRPGVATPRAQPNYTTPRPGLAQGAQAVRAKQPAGQENQRRQSPGPYCKGKPQRAAASVAPRRFWRSGQSSGPGDSRCTWRPQVRC